MNDESVLRKSVVAILDGRKSSIVGTGFVIAKQHIITCSHVIEATGREAGEYADFLLPSSSKTYRGLLASNLWFSTTSYDFCLLEISDEISKELPALPIAEAQESIGNDFLSLGYPELGDYVGLWAHGTIAGKALKGKEQSMLQLSSAQLTQGHSGAPIWDKKRKVAVGIVVEVYIPGRDMKNRDTCFALPLETVSNLCPEPGLSFKQKTAETELELHILDELSKFGESASSLEDLARTLNISTAKSKLLLERLQTVGHVSFRRQVLGQRIINFYAITAAGREYLNHHN